LEILSADRFWNLPDGVFSDRGKIWEAPPPRLELYLVEEQITRSPYAPQQFIRPLILMESMVAEGWGFRGIRLIAFGLGSGAA